MRYKEQPRYYKFMDKIKEYIKFVFKWGLVIIVAIFVIYVLLFFSN